MPRLRTCFFFFFFQAEDGIRDVAVTGVQTCALPILARASAELSGLPTDVMALAQAMDRGRRSGVGTWTFAYGGFVLEGGRTAGTERVAPLFARLPFPDSWRCVVAVPRGKPGLAGDDEAAAFARLPSPSARHVEHVAPPVLMH